MIAIALALALATDAAAAFTAGDFPRATTAYETALHADPNDFDALVRLAALHLYDEDLDGAQTYLARAAALQPQSPRVASIQMVLDGRRAVRAGLVNASLAAPEVDVPFVANEPLPLVTVSVNGHDALFVVDTGAPDIIIDPDFAHELGIAMVAAGNGIFAGGKTAPIERAVVDRFAVGGAVVRAMAATTNPTRRLPFFPGRRVDGILGTGFFERFTATIDYPHARLVFRARGTPTDDPREIAMPMWLVGDHFIFARGRVNDAPETQFLVDTGLAGGGLMPSQATVSAANIVLDTKNTGTGTGGGGQITAIPFVAKRIQLGAAVQTDIPGIYTPEGTPFGIFPFTVGGAISHLFLEHYAVTFDFAHMQLVLRP
jgi:predicted aspartyl protease